MRHLFSLLLLLVAATASAAPPAQDVPGAIPDSLLGNSGEVYTLHAGEYGDLFPEGRATAVSNSVLALDVESIDGESRRILVPGTQGGPPEAAFGLLYDQASGALTVLWQNNGVDSGKLLRMTRFDGDGWSGNTTIKDSTLSPILRTESRVTRDRYLIDVEDGAPQMIERTILHLVWAADEGGLIDVRYAPIIFLEGRYVGWNETVSLRDLLLDDASSTITGEASVLETAFSVDVTRDGQRLQAAFVSSLTGELSVVNLGVQPLELAMLSDSVVKILYDLEDLFDPQAPEALSDEARFEIVGTGIRAKLNGRLVAYVAQEIRSEILAVASEYEGRYDDFVAYLRQLTIELTTPLVTTGVSYIPGLGDGQVLQIDLGDLLGGPTTQILDLHVLGSVPAPAAPALESAGAAASIFISPTADALIVAWEDDGALYWQERSADEWSEVRRLSLEKLSAEQGKELLRRRVR